MRPEIFFVVLLLCSGVAMASIAECPTFLSTKYMDIPAAYTFKDLKISSCSEIGGTADYWNDYCTNTYSTSYRAVYACCSDPLQVAVCYIGKHPTSLDDNIAYKMFMSIANGETGIRSCTSVGNNVYSSTSFDFTTYGMSSCKDQQGSYYFAWDDKCTDAMGTPGYGCCSDSLKKIRCYTYNTPTNFMFQYLDDTVAEGSSVRYRYSASNVNHYEAQDWHSETNTWGSWTSIGSSSCPVACSGDLVGTPGLHKMRVRACGGPNIGEACTAYIEDSFTTLAPGQTPADASAGSTTTTGTGTTGTGTTSTGSTIAACPTDFGNVNTLEYLTFSNLSISQCSDLQLSQADADKYCHDTYPEAANVHACCSDEGHVAGCYRSDGTSGTGSTGTTTSGETTGTGTTGSTGTSSGPVQGSTIAICPTGLSNLSTLEYLTFSNLGISQCSDLQLSQADADKYCQDKYPEAANVHACCSDDWKVSGCYGSGIPTDFNFSILFGSGVDCTTCNPKGASMMYWFSATGADHFEKQSSYEDGPWSSWHDIGYPSCAKLPHFLPCVDKINGSAGIYHTRMRACSGSGLGEGCTDPIEGSYRVLSDQVNSSVTPRNFTFKYVNSEVYEKPPELSIAYILKATGENHFEKQSSYEDGPWSDWENIGNPHCWVFGCMTSDKGAPGIHHTRMRACSGSGLGESCTDPIESSYTVLPGEEGVPTDFTFYFAPAQVHVGDEVFIHYNANNANHFEISAYITPDHPVSTLAMGWTDWVAFSLSDAQFESECRSASGCSPGKETTPGVYKVRMRACGGSQIGQKCTDPIEAQWEVLP